VEKRSQRVVLVKMATPTKPDHLERLRVIAVMRLRLAFFITSRASVRSGHFASHDCVPEKSISPVLYRIFSSVRVLVFGMVLDPLGRLCRRLLGILFPPATIPESQILFVFSEILALPFPHVLAVTLSLSVSQHGLEG
jgi:hypothetical protein